MCTQMNVVISRSDFARMSAAGRDRLRAIRDTYKGPSFIDDIEQVSGVNRERLLRVLDAPDEDLLRMLSGLEWERLLSAARVFPEDLLADSGVRYEQFAGPPSSEFAASSNGQKPGPETDKRVRGLFNVMSDFYLMASLESAPYANS